MAKLHRECGGEENGEEDLPELWTALGLIKEKQLPSQSQRSSTKRHDTMRLTTKSKAQGIEVRVTIPNLQSDSMGRVDGSCFEERRVRKQRPLGDTHVNSFSLPIHEALLKSSSKLENCYRENEDTEQKRVSPTRTAKQRVDFDASVSKLSDTINLEESSDSLSDFIVYDSTSDAEVRLQRSSGRQEPAGRDSHSQKSKRMFKNTSRESSCEVSVADSSTEALVETISALHLREDTIDISSQESNANLNFSPSMSKSPHKILDETLFLTPPSSPSKPRLKSPSKAQRVPPSPHRPSIDAFWSQEVINDWNDQYSPRKLFKTKETRTLPPLGEEYESCVSPPSPQRKPTKSPTKKDKLFSENKKVFDGRKQEIAISFLHELDQQINSGQIVSLASQTGGIRVVWSKKLNSTAGRANWKREAIRSKNPEGLTTVVGYRHHASIELAEKVIDDEDRLLNVIAHEYCHLANFMIGGIKNNPHGKEFKEWAKKCTAAFAHKNIHVTTKHTYAIAYKYIWACASCGIEYQRHSKSIDPARHRCGSCKSKLVQVQPAPRTAAAKDGKGKGGLSGYQEYVRKNFKRVREENGAVGMAEVMGVLGKAYREEKRSTVKSEADVEVVEILHSDEEDDVTTAPEGTKDVECVARKLDFLGLRHPSEDAFVALSGPPE